MSINGLRNGMVALYDGDSQVQAITGRTEGNLVMRGTDEEGQLPVATYYMVSAIEPGGTDHRRRVLVQFEVWGTIEKGHTPSLLHNLMSRAEALFTGPSLATQGVDASVFLGTLRDGVIDQAAGIISLAQDFQFELVV